MKTAENLTKEECFLVMQQLIPGEVMAKMSLMIMTAGVEETMNICKIKETFPYEVVTVIRKGMDYMLLNGLKEI